MFFDAMLKYGREVLVARVMERKTLAEGSECAITTGLRPTIGIHIGVQTTIGTSVNVRTATKNGRG